MTFENNNKSINSIKVFSNTASSLRDNYYLLKTVISMNLSLLTATAAIGLFLTTTAVFTFAIN